MFEILVIALTAVVLAPIIVWGARRERARVERLTPEQRDADWWDNQW